MKEKIAEILARIDERLKIHIAANTEAHQTILTKLDKLDEHVNHEVSNLDKRVRALEELKISLESKYKGRMELFKWISIGLTILVGIITFLQLIGCI